MESIVESKLFHRGVIVLIFLNAVIVGLETYPNIHANYGELLRLADRSILYLFTLELALRFFAARGPREFFKSGWNIFDLVIVAVSFLPASQFFTVARLFRILRVLRAVSALPDLQRLVAALLRSLPSLGHISLLLVLLIYVYGAIGTSFFATASPQYFGSAAPERAHTLRGYHPGGMGGNHGRNSAQDALGLALFCHFHPCRNICRTQFLRRDHCQQSSIPHPRGKQ